VSFLGRHARHRSPYAAAEGPRTGFHRIATSIVEMALITGVVVRVIHVVARAHGGDHLDWHAFVGTFVVVPVVLLAMATVHLSNFPVPQWLWRAPAFALLEIVVEALTSLGLIEAGRERWGTGRAELGDWSAIAGGILVWRFVTICLFALVLGVVVQWVRRREFAAERRAYHGVERRGRP